MSKKCTKMSIFKFLAFLLYFLHCCVSDFVSALNSQRLNGNYEGCYTPDQQLGQCVEVTKCSQLSILRQQKPLSTAIADYLKKSHCGFEGLQPKVCCALDVGNELVSKPSSDGTFSDLLPDTNTCGLHEYYILRGTTHASIKEFPWLVLLQYEKPNGVEFNCGGTLINRRYVLTSAHCVARLPESWKLIKVRLGEYNLNTRIDCYNDTNRGNTQQCADVHIDIRVAQKIVHEQYDPADPTQRNDIALLRLSKDVIFTDFIKPICLPKSSDLLSDGNTDGKMTEAGWGLLSEMRSHSNVKLKSRVALKSYNDCSSVYDTIHVSLHGQLCTEGQDSCIVDSGGPLMVNNSTSTGFNWYIAGVKSFGPTPCGNNNWPDVYTKVINYVDWIVSHMAP